MSVSAELTPPPVAAVTAPAKKPSYVKSLFLGQPATELVLPYPALQDDDRAATERLVAAARDYLRDVYDPLRAEREGWVGDDTIRDLGDLGLLGLFVERRFGGQGLSQTGYCRVMEEFGRVDGALSVVLGVHQSIGTKPLHLFGNEEQKARYLPDLAAGRKLAAFVLTEPNVGSDAYSLETRAERQADGSWRLNGVKRWIGNGDRDVLTVFARSELGHVALIVDGGTAGIATERLATVGLTANRLQRVEFRDVRVPAENLLGEVGDGFRIAMATLNNGRMSMGAAITGGMKGFLDLSLEHTSARRQFGRALIDFGLVEDKIAWLTTQTYGMEALSYLTTGLVDRGDADYSMESAVAKVLASDTGWYGLNRAFQLHGGTAYMADHPLAKALRDFRIFPIFEGSNDVLRAFVSLQGLKALGGALPDLRGISIRTPMDAAGVIAPYVRERVVRAVAPPKLDGAHPVLAKPVARIAEQTAQLRGAAEQALRSHGKGVQEQQLLQRRLFAVAAGITAQTAVVSRLSSAMSRPGGADAGEQVVAEQFLAGSRRDVRQALRGIEHNGDARTVEIGRLTRAAGGYPFE